MKKRNPGRNNCRPDVRWKKCALKECINMSHGRMTKNKRIVGIEMSQMLIPNTVTEACQMLSSGNRVACAGATNLYVDREKGKYLDRDIVSLHRLKELSGIREEKDGWHIAV